MRSYFRIGTVVAKWLYVKTYYLHFSSKVSGGKYRELLNILELELKNEMLKGCVDRSIYQSVEDLNVITFIEEWNDFKLLKSSFQSSTFKYMLGAIKNLTDNWSIEVLETKEVKELKTIGI